MDASPVPPSPVAAAARRALRRSAVATLVSGTALHFVYPLTGDSVLVAWFAPVNESVWEHLKLVAVPPAALWGAARALGRDRPAPVPAAALAAVIAVSMATVPLGFAAYTALTGRSVLPLDLLLFVIAVLAGHAAGLAVARAPWGRAPAAGRAGAAVVAAALVAIVAFSFRAPAAGIFEPPDAAAAWGGGAQGAGSSNSTQSG